MDMAHTRRSKGLNLITFLRNTGFEPITFRNLRA
ncbi:uncharacterized protein FFB14_13696 [Fusarium fujikuroi]|nr:uncharacterized protein FFB14_13696 [Fusarium fujikuroi]